ncbi:MAG: hypothetical protein IRZ03_18720 [Acidobacterium ailaaui]|nr:hypothetical protein [Pseudacidobacterium ailaaui]
MRGYSLCSEYYSVFAVAALDMGLFPQAFTEFWPDRFAYAKEIATLDDLLYKHDYLFKKYRPQKLVSRDGDSLIWRPDPEFNYSGYRVARYIKFVPVGKVKAILENGKEITAEHNAVIAEWETGTDDRSTFIDFVIDQIYYTRFYEDLRNNLYLPKIKSIVLPEPYTAVKLDKL